MSGTETPRWSWPLLQPGQAQKEMTHNEALAGVDLVAGASVAALGVDTPPASPVAGQCWAVGASPSGAWAGHALAIAGWTDAGWRFAGPREGLAVWDEANGREARFVGGAWRSGQLTAASLSLGGQQVVGARGAAIAAPSGGTVVDDESRAAIGAMLAALRNHGLIAG